MRRKLREIISQFRFNVWCLDGLERGSNEPLSLLYAGRHLPHKNYIAGLAFRSIASEIYIGKMWLWNIWRRLEKMKNNYNLSIVEYSKLARRFLGTEGFYVPLWLGGELQFDAISKQIQKNRTLKSLLRKITMFSLTYKITKEKNYFFEFYHKMYLCHTRKTHGDKVILHPIDEMAAKINKSELLLVKSGDEFISGGIIVHEEKIGPVLWCLGKKASLDENIDACALGAVYYYAYVYLSARGFEKIHMGGSRPFCEDGVLQYKKKWGMHLLGCKNQGFFIKPLSLGAGGRAFLRNHPFVYQRNGKLGVARFADDWKAISEDDRIRQCQDLSFRGIDSVNFYSLNLWENSARTPEPIWSYAVLQ